MTNHEGHYKLWDELSKTGDESKYKALKAVFPDMDEGDEIYELQCFACVEAGDDCKHCPINWGIDVDGCCQIGSPYLKWEDSKNPDERKRLAAIIRDLEWKEKA